MRRALVVCALVACAEPPTPIAAPPTAAPPVAAAPVDLGSWRSLSFGVALAPRTGPDRLTVIWHFHACRSAERDYRELFAEAAIVCLNNLGLGTTPYQEAFRDPTRFATMQSEVLRVLSDERGRPVTAARTVLVAWSAGYASIKQILAVPDYYAQTSAVVLLDGLHTDYLKAPDGSQTVHLESVGPILQFATDAAAGHKTFVFTHTSIVPPGYASTTEVARALQTKLSMKPAPDPDFPVAREAFDQGDAHIRGFDGTEAKDHIAQLHLVGPALRKWVLK